MDQTKDTSQSTSGMAIAALILGILALLTSFLPIINNGSFLLAIVGLILAIVGFVGVRKGKKKGKGIAIAGIVLNVLALIFVLVSQSMYSAAIDTAVNGPSASVTATTEEAASNPDLTKLPLGSVIETTEGLSVSVDSYKTGLKNYDGTALTSITVSYTNNGNKEASFNSMDWKGQDTSGTQRSTTYYSKSSNDLSYGSLAPGGSVTGEIYFEGSIAQVNYYGSIMADEPTASWVLK